MECYYALDENETPIFTQKIGKKPLCIGDELLVQVSKEAVKTKVPTVSGKLSFTGKYAVLTTGDTRIGISSKLPKESREHFQKLAASYQSDAYGFIIRTNAKDVAEEVLKAELEQLIQEYEELVKIAGTRVCYSCLKKGAEAIFERAEKYLPGWFERNCDRRSNTLRRDYRLSENVSTGRSGKMYIVMKILCFL